MSKIALVTGATGLVGGEVLRILRSTRPDFEIHTLGRGAANSIPCDLASTLPDSLPRNFTHILHCAADTRFGRPLDEIRAVNVEGTRRLLDFASRCERLEAFAHVSTAYACGRETGVIGEHLLDRPRTFSNTYQQSKWEAECLAGEAMAKLPMSITRISSIFGHSETGAVTQYNYTHQLLKLLARNVLPVAPVDPRVPVDLVPIDWVARRLAAVLLNEFEPGSVSHLCAGAAGSLPAGEMIERAMRGYESHPAGARWLPIVLPRFVPLVEYEEFAAKALSGEDRLLREVVRLLDFFLPHLALSQRFEVSGGDPAPAATAYFDRVVQHCLSDNWGLHA